MRSNETPAGPLEDEIGSKKHGMVISPNRGVPGLQLGMPGIFGDR